MERTPKLLIVQSQIRSMLESPLVRTKHIVHDPIRPAFKMHLHVAKWH